MATRSISTGYSDVHSNRIDVRLSFWSLSNVFRLVSLEVAWALHGLGS